MKYTCSLLREILGHDIHEPRPQYVIEARSSSAYFDLSVERYIFFLNIIEKFRSASENRLLEIGPYLGHVSIALKKDGWVVSAVDVEEYATDSRFRQRFEKYGIVYKSCNLSKDMLPFEDNAFDLVIADAQKRLGQSISQGKCNRMRYFTSVKKVFDRRIGVFEKSQY